MKPKRPPRINIEIEAEDKAAIEKKWASEYRGLPLNMSGLCRALLRAWAAGRVKLD